MPTWRPEVRDVRGVQDIEVHGVGRVIMREDTTPDPLPRVQSGDHPRIYDNIPLSHARERTGNRLELIAGQSYRAPPAGI